MFGASVEDSIAFTFGPPRQLPSSDYEHVLNMLVSM